MSENRTFELAHESSSFALKDLAADILGAPNTTVGFTDAQFDDKGKATGHHQAVYLLRDDNGYVLTCATGDFQSPVPRIVDEWAVTFTEEGKITNYILLEDKEHEDGPPADASQERARQLIEDNQGKPGELIRVLKWLRSFKPHQF